jgi:hypothetical protein
MDAPIFARHPPPQKPRENVIARGNMFAACLLMALSPKHVNQLSNNKKPSQ